MMNEWIKDANPDDDEDDDEEEEEEEDEDEDEEEEEDEELEDLGRSSEPRRRRLVCVRWSIGEHVPFDEFPGESIYIRHTVIIRPRKFMVL